MTDPIVKYMTSGCCNAALEVTGQTPKFYVCSECKNPAKWVNKPKEEIARIMAKDKPTFKINKNDKVECERCNNIGLKK